MARDDKAFGSALHVSVFPNRFLQSSEVGQITEEERVTLAQCNILLLKNKQSDCNCVAFRWVITEVVNASGRVPVGCETFLFPQHLHFIFFHGKP